MLRLLLMDVNEVEEAGRQSPGDGKLVQQPLAAKPTNHPPKAVEGGKQQHVHLLATLPAPQSLHMLTWQTCTYVSDAPKIIRPVSG